MFGLLIFALFVCVTAGVFFINNTVNKKIIDSVRKENEREPYEDYDTVMKMLDDLIDRTFSVKYMLGMDLYDKLVIYDFEKDSKEMVSEIIRSIGDGAWKDLNYYLSRDYVIKYTTRRVHDLLMKLIREKKIAVK